MDAIEPPHPVRRPAPANFTSHDFTTPRGIHLNARIWPAETSSADPTPIAVYTHGGAWIGGNHFAPLPWMEAGLRRRGWHVVTHNYRLAPQVSMDEQVQDCVEAVQWVLENLGRILRELGIGDIGRYVLVGDSAGAMLTANTALRLKTSPPSAVVLAYGTMDLFALPGVWTEADDAVEQAVEDGAPFPRGPWTGKHSAEELHAYLANRDPDQTLCDAVWWDELDLFTANHMSSFWRLDPAWEITPRLRLQAELQIYRMLRNTASDAWRVWFHAERFQTRDEVRDFVKSFSVVHQLAEADAFPPTAFLHGTADALTPQEHSEKAAGILRTKGVPVLESYEAGERHVFDDKYTGPDVPGWDAYIEPVLTFVNKHARHRVMLA